MSANIIPFLLILNGKRYRSERIANQQNCLNVCDQKVKAFNSLCLQIGETIKIVIEDYVQHLSGYHFKLKFDPELLFNQQFQYQNRIAAEFNTLYHWHPLLPDTFQIDEQEYNFKQFLYNNSILIEHGLTQFVESFTRQNAGRVSIMTKIKIRHWLVVRISATEIIFPVLLKEWPVILVVNYFLAIRSLKDF
jgi:hypothetical protein